MAGPIITECSVCFMDALWTLHAGLQAFGPLQYGLKSDSYYLLFTLAQRRTDLTGTLVLYSWGCSFDIQTGRGVVMKL